MCQLIVCLNLIKDLNLVFKFNIKTEDKNYCGSIHFPLNIKQNIEKLTEEDMKSLHTCLRSWYSIPKDYMSHICCSGGGFMAYKKNEYM